MDIRPIRNDDDHRQALVEIDRLWKSSRDTPDGNKLDVLVTLVEAYEQTRWPIGNVSPRDILQYAISDMGRTQAELARLLGSRSMASELLSGKRKVTLATARKISAAWGTPIQLLVAPYDEGDAHAA